MPGETLNQEGGNPKREKASLPGIGYTTLINIKTEKFESLIFHMQILNAKININ